MKKFTFITFICLAFVLSAFAQERKCNCLSASRKEVPSQGNIFDISNAGKVKQIKGIVKWAYNLEPMKDAVIEVFKVSENEILKKTNYNGYSNDPDVARNQKIYQIAQDKKRKTACKTNENGKFCFSNLSMGMYILRIGLNRLVDKSGMNEIYYVVEIDRKNGENYEIEASINTAN